MTSISAEIVLRMMMMKTAGKTVIFIILLLKQIKIVNSCPFFTRWITKLESFVNNALYDCFYLNLQFAYWDALFIVLVMKCIFVMCVKVESITMEAQRV